jgi:hypothetical protein
LLRKRLRSGGVGAAKVGDTLPAGEFAPDGQPKDCGGGGTHSALRCVSAAVIGGDIRSTWFVDETSAGELAKWSADRKRQLSSLRELLEKAVRVVKEAAPAADPLLRAVHMGYDATSATAYYGFCAGRGKHIVINLHSFLQDSLCASESQRHVAVTVYDFIGTVTHEIAHALTDDGHQAAWRHAHHALLKAVFHRPS